MRPSEEWTERFDRIEIAELVIETRTVAGEIRRPSGPDSPVYLGYFHFECKIPSMKASEALRRVANLSAAQWGLFTSAQAAEQGVSHVTLTRLVDRGDLERVTHGVYKDPGAPRDRLEALRAAWLSTAPKVKAEDRLRWESVASMPASGTTAAELHEVGDLQVDRYEFTTPTRKQSQRQELRYRIRDLDATDITIKEGLPVTTLERTIADLVEERHELTHVAAVVRDAAAQRPLDEDRISKLMAPLAARNGLRRKDGDALWTRITELAGLDAETTVSTVTNSNLGPLVASSYFAAQNKALQGALAEAAKVTTLADTSRAVIELPALKQAREAAAAYAKLAEQIQQIVKIDYPTELLETITKLHAAVDTTALKKLSEAAKPSPAFLKAMEQATRASETIRAAQESARKIAVSPALARAVERSGSD